MISLYNLKHAGDQYRITKFDENMNVESTYLSDGLVCQCPAFVRRNRCRHVEMIPLFLARKAVGTGECYDYSRGGWVRMFDDPPAEQIKVNLQGIPTPMTDALLASPEFAPKPKWPKWRRL